MKFNIGNALAGAAAIRTGQLAGQTQGKLENYNRSLQAWHTGHQLENEDLQRQDQADQTLLDAANLMEPDDPNKATYVSTALNNRYNRTRKPRRFGQESMPVLPGMERLFPPAPASNPGVAPSPPVQSAPAAPVTPPGVAPAAGGVGPTAPAGPTPPPQGPPLATPGTPLPPPLPQYAPEQMAMMRAAFGVAAPLMPGGHMFANILNAAPNQSPPPGGAPPAAPAAPTVPPVAPMAPVTPPAGPTAPVPPATATAGTPTPPGEGMLSVGGLPAFSLGGTVSKADQKNVFDQVKAARDFVSKLGSDALDPLTRNQLMTAMAGLPSTFGKKGDIEKGRQFLAMVNPLMLSGNLALRGRTDAENQQKVAEIKDRFKGLTNLDPQALSSELPSLYDDLESLRGDKTFHGSLPATLKSSQDDIQHIRDLTEQAKQAADSGDQAKADRLNLQAQGYAKMVSARVTAKKSSQEEDRSMRQVMADLKDASTAQRQDPNVVRAIYKRHGLDYLADKMSDEELTAGGGAVAEKSFNSMMIRLHEMAKLGKWSGQGTFLQALGEAAKQAGQKIDIPAELVLQMTPLERARLRNMNQQFTLAGNADERANASAALAKDKFAWQKHMDDVHLNEWHMTHGKNGKKGVLTQNEMVQAPKQMWMRASDSLSKYLSAIKNPEEDVKTMTPAERAKYQALKTDERRRRKEYIDAVSSRGGPHLSMDATDEGPGVNIPTSGGTRKPAGQMTTGDIFKELGQLGGG